MDLLLFAALAVGYAVSTWNLLRQSRVPRALWETGPRTRWLSGIGYRAQPSRDVRVLPSTTPGPYRVLSHR